MFKIPFALLISTFANHEGSYTTGNPRQCYH